MRPSPLLHFLVFALVLLLPVDSTAQPNLSRPFFTVYYPTWAMRPLGQVPEALPPWEIDWRGITHVVHFHVPVRSQTAPYFGPVVSANDSIEVEFNGLGNPGAGPSTWIHWQDSLITIAHRHGVKVVLSIDAVNPTEWNIVTADSAKTVALARSAVEYCIRKGYDGLEINVETWTGTPVINADLNRAMRIFRRELNKMSPRGLLLNSASRTHATLYEASQDSTVDQFLLQCYSYANVWNPTVGSNSVWHLTPLHRGAACPGSEAQALSDSTGIGNGGGPKAWIAAGHDPKKISVGIASFGYVYKGQKELCVSSGSNPPGYAKYQDCIGLLANGGTEFWDDACKVPYITGTAKFDDGPDWWGKFGVKAGRDFFATYENQRSVEEKISWIKSAGLGGIMVYDLTMDLDASKPINQRNAIHAWVAQALRLR